MEGKRKAKILVPKEEKPEEPKEKLYEKKEINEMEEEPTEQFQKNFMSLYRQIKNPKNKKIKYILQKKRIHQPVPKKNQPVPIIVNVVNIKIEDNNEEITKILTKFPIKKKLETKDGNLLRDEQVAEPVQEDEPKSGSSKKI
jgi:hypothetical protein